MPLTDAQKATVEEWIKTRAPRFECPACGAKTWGIQNDLAFPLVVQADNLRIDRDAGFPLVVITCNNCAHTSFFSAVQMGLVKLAR